MTERSTTGFVRTLLGFRDDGVDGTLIVRAEGITTVLSLRKGELISAEGGTLGETLGRLLVEQQVLTQEQYAHAIESMTESLVHHAGTRLGEVLIQLGYMGVADVERALADQVRRKLMGCLRGERMDLSFRKATGTSYAHFPTQLEPALLEGVVRFFSRERMMRAINPVMTHRLVVHDAADVIERFHLRGDGVQWVRGLDGSRTGSQMLERLGPNRNALAVMATLMMCGHLRVREAPATPRPTVKRMRRAPTNPRPNEVRTRRVSASERRLRSNRRTGEGRAHHAPIERAPISQKPGYSLFRGNPQDAQATTKRQRLEAERAYNFGLKHLYDTRYAQALRRFEEAINAAPDVLEYALGAAFCRFRLSESSDGVLDRREKLMTLAHQAERQDPTLDLPPYVLGHLAMFIGDDERALGAFTTAIENDPDNRDAARCVRLLTSRLGRQP